MKDTKDLFMEAHEELVSEYLEANPNATWGQAYDATADNAHDRMMEKLWDRADFLKDQAKYM